MKPVSCGRCPMVGCRRSVATGGSCDGRATGPERRGRRCSCHCSKGKRRTPPAMGALHLIPLLASLQTLLLPVAPTALPPPPNITVTPEKLEYLIGDTIAIQCTAPWSKKIQGFQFSGTSGWAVDIRTTRKTYVYRFNVTGPKDGGAHACTYTVINQFRQTVRSQDSKSIIISVKDRPPQPTLVLKSPSRVTVEGQPLVFLCTAPATDAERKFHFYKGKIEVIGGAELILGNAEAQLRLGESDRNHTGNFTCRYEEKTEGRWIRSYLSQAVEILVKEPAAAPRLGVEPPSGVVSEDDPLRLTCVASRTDFKLKFRFYRNGAEIPPGQGGSKSGNVGNSSHLFFPRSPRRFSGRFSCGVEEEVGGTWVPAARSEAVEVAVKDLPSQPALLLEPASGHVTDGDPLALTCVAAGPLAQRKFTFYKDAAQQFSAMTSEDRALFTIPVAETALTTGLFTCRYEEKLNDRWIPSPLSQSRRVITQARFHLVPLAAGCAAGAVTLLLGLLLAVCLCRRRRGGVHWKGLHNKEDASTYPMANVYGGDA